MDAINNALEHLRQNGGFTLHPQTLEPITPQGYAVAIPGHEQVVTNPQPRHIQRLVNKSQAMNDPQLHLGAWMNPEDGKTYFDLSKIVPNLEDAMHLGRQYAQKAIWDFGNMVGIPIDPGHTSAVGDLSLHDYKKLIFHHLIEGPQDHLARWVDAGEYQPHKSPYNVQPGEFIEMTTPHTPWLWGILPPSERNYNRPEDESINKMLGISDENFEDRRDWAPIQPGTIGEVIKSQVADGSGGYPALVKFQDPYHGELTEYVPHHKFKRLVAPPTIPWGEEGNEYYRGAHTSSQQVMYHVAPRSARESILANGLDHRVLHGEGEAPEGYGARGNYLSEQLSDAQSYAQDTDSDIWVVDHNGLDLTPDEAWYKGWYSQSPIPPNRLRLLSDDRTAAENWRTKYNYRDSEGSKSCHTCAAFKNGNCKMFDAKVNPDYVCDEWTDTWPEKKKSAFDFSDPYNPEEMEGMDYYEKRVPWIVHSDQVYFGKPGDHHTDLEYRLRKIDPATNRVPEGLQTQLYGNIEPDGTVTHDKYYTDLDPERQWYYHNLAQKMYQEGTMRIAAETAKEPDYSFVYYKSALEIEPWNPSVRPRNLAERLLQRFNLTMGDTGWQDDGDEWTGGDVYDEDGSYRVEFKQLAPPEIQQQALVAIQNYMKDPESYDDRSSVVL